MDKCIVLILAITVVSVTNNRFQNDSSNECIDKLAVGQFYEGDSGLEAFEIAYYDLTKEVITQINCDTLRSYYEDLLVSATTNCKKNVLLSPINWCNKRYKNDPECLNALVDADYVVTENGVLRELSSIEALKQSYHNIHQSCDQLNKVYTKRYYEYIYAAYKPILCTKYLKSPVQFCMGINPFDIPTSQVISDENADVQDGNPNAGEGTSQKRIDRVNGIVLDNDGLEIDLNKP